MVLNAFTLRDIYSHYFNPPFRQLQRVLDTEISPGDLIVTSDCFTVGPSLYSLAYGDYVLLLWHDENRSFQPDQRDGRLAEGTWI